MYPEAAPKTTSTEVALGAQTLNSISDWRRTAPRVRCHESR